MNLLAIDTTTELATVALVVNGKMVSEKQEHLREHAQFLLPMIERLLALAGVHFNQLDGIVFGCGPGSFTGVRIACSVAKGLAYAHDLPLFSVNSLTTIAYSVFMSRQIPRASDLRVLALLDARMQQLYWAIFSAELDAEKIQVTAAEEVTHTSLGPLIVAGVGFESYIGQLASSIQTSIVEQRIMYPTATAMIQYVLAGHCQPEDAVQASPLYIRNKVAYSQSNDTPKNGHVECQAKEHKE